MELLVGKWHIFIDALLGEATLPWVPLVWIPEYLARLMKLSEISDEPTGASRLFMPTTRTRDDDSTFKGCCGLRTSAITESFWYLVNFSVSGSVKCWRRKWKVKAD